MRYLITGNTGYVGSILVEHLRSADEHAELTGFDAGFFAHCLTAAHCLPETGLTAQYWGDVRRFPESLLQGVDLVVHLAAVSNDPMGKRFERVTGEINHRASVQIARLAKRHGARAFVFASSCSMYGSSGESPRKEGDPLNPLTAYAASKVHTEQEIGALAGKDYVVTSLRFSTACGLSPRLRLDLVLNDFIACAVSSGEITVLSDGTPWRPLINVRDMARAIHWACRRSPDDGGEFLAVNVGSESWNYQVKDLARAVASIIPGTRVSINPNAQPDRRSYRVDFSLFRELAPRHQPLFTLEQTIRELKNGLESMKFSDSNFRETEYMRLKVLENHIRERRLTEELFWA